MRVSSHSYLQIMPFQLARDRVAEAEGYLAGGRGKDKALAPVTESTSASQRIIKSFYGTTITPLARKAKEQIERITQEDPDNPLKDLRPKLDALIEYSGGIEGGEKPIALGRVAKDLDEVVTIKHNADENDKATFASDVTFGAGEYELTEQGRRALRQWHSGPQTSTRRLQRAAPAAVRSRVPYGPTKARSSTLSGGSATGVESLEACRMRQPSQPTMELDAEPGLVLLTHCAHLSYNRPSPLSSPTVGSTAEGGHVRSKRDKGGLVGDCLFEDYEKRPGRSNWPAPATSILVGATLLLTGVAAAGDSSKLSRDLLKAVYRHDTVTLGRLLEKGARPNDVVCTMRGHFQDCRKPLTEALQVRFGRGTRLLLEAGADPAYAADINYEQKGWAPLHQLARNEKNMEGAVGIAELMLSKGADVNAQTAQGQTALVLLLTGEHSDQRAALVELLVERGAGPAGRNERGETPLMLVAKAGMTGVIQRLVDRGAQLTARDDWGLTPFYAAVRNEDWTTAKHIEGLGGAVFPKGKAALICEPPGQAFGGFHPVVIKSIDGGSDECVFSEVKEIEAGTHEFTVTYGSSRYLWGQATRDSVPVEEKTGTAPLTVTVALDEGCVYRLEYAESGATWRAWLSQVWPRATDNR